MENPPQITARRSIPPPVPRPVVSAAMLADARFDWILPALIVLGFGCTLVLPMASASVLKSAEQVADFDRGPIDVGSRTCAFFLAGFGGWGLVLYVWACCVYSLSKGRAWRLGLLGLPALLSFICLAFTGKPVLGILSVLGLGGFLVPLVLKPDRVLLAASGSVSKTSVMIRLAKKTTWMWALCLFVGASLAYGNSFRGGMTLDNKYIIEEYYKAVAHINPTSNLFSWTTMLPLFFQNDYWWPKGISGLYRPVAAMSYWMNYATNHAMGNEPLDPFQYHVVNFFLHWIAAYLGFILVRQLSGRTVVAFFTALLFVTHPIATESVSNIIGRSDILAAITVFGCLVLYIRSTRAGPLARVLWLLAMMATLAVGLFSKESAIAVVGAIVVYDVIYRWTLEDLRGAVPSLLGFSLLSAIGAVIGLWIGQFGALGLSEGLRPVLVIVLVGSLLVAGALALAWTFWVARNPLDLGELTDATCV